MSVEDRSEWLTVAAQSVGHIPASLLDEACLAAQRVCDHPSKIIPAVCAYAEENRSAWEYRNRPVVHAPRLTAVPKAPPPKPQPMTQAEVDATPQHLVSLGIACGAIVRGDDGNLRPAPLEDSAA